MSRKVFTAGEVLAAADVNSFLMDQTVMSFAGTAARGSAIPTPVTGMTTYLEDIKDLRIYNGASWSSPSGATLVGSNDFTNQSSVSFNNIFTSDYDFYEIRASLIAVSSASNLGIRLRAGTDLATGYNFTRVNLNASSVTGIPSSGDTNWRAGVSRTTNRTLVNITLANPAKSGVAKNYLYTEFNQDGSTLEFNTGGGINAGTAVYDGFTYITVSGNISGSIRVYGLRN